MVKIGECLTNSIKNTSFSTVKSIFGLPLREGEDIAWLVSDSGMEEMRGRTTVDRTSLQFIRV